MAFIRKIPCWRCFVGSLLTLVVVVSGTAARADWKAGVARAEITPEQPMWMSGYGSRNRPAEGKLTELWAKALVVEDPDGQRAVLITLDLVGIDRGISSRVCAAIEDRYGLPRRAVAISTSHTHSGPVVGENLRAMYALDQQGWKLVAEYTERLEQQIISIVGEALEDLGPAQLSWGVGRAHFAVNRRNNPETQVPELREADQLQGPVDHDVPVLVVGRSDGPPLTLVCGYACHATVLSGYEWCGDWPGYAQIELESRFPGTMAMVWAGCGADQNPLPRRQVEMAQDYGKQICDAVAETLQRPLQPITGVLTAQYAEIPLPLSELPNRAELLRQIEEGNRYEVGRARQLLEQLDTEGKLAATYPYPVQSWRLGDGPQWIFLGGEVVVDYALRLKLELGAGRTWVAAYCNDVMAYIPSLRVLREGGYEGGGSMVYYGLPSPWDEEVEERVVAEARRQIAESGGPADDANRNLPSRPYPDHSDLSVYRDAAGQLQPIRSADDWARRREDILIGMQHAMGRLPQASELQPLEVQELARQQGSGYTRQTITYRVDAGPPTTADLYVPEGIPPGQRRPAVLALHPTSPLGKRVVAGEGPLPNRSYATELAERGYVVLAPDYPSFGDDSDYDFHIDPYLSGSMKGIANHIRGVDLLAARPDVDPTRIAAIGHSLGGHNAMFAGVFDPRLAAIVSSCGWTPFADYYGGKLAGWTSDRYMPRLRELYGLDPTQVPFDFYEVAAAIAPRAFFSCSPLHDSNFDVAGVKKAEPKVREVYRLLGAEDRFVIRYPDAEHDFPSDTRREAYAFLDRVLDHTPTSQPAPPEASEEQDAAEEQDATESGSGSPGDGRAPGPKQAPNPEQPPTESREAAPVSPDRSAAAASGTPAKDDRPHVVIMVGEAEYETAESLAQYARAALEPNGLRYTFVHADPQNKHHFPGLEAALEQADLLLLSVRRRALSEDQLAAVRDYLNSGRPLVGIRTSSHAFALRDGEPPAGHQQWSDFDQQVLGGKYENHYGNSSGTDVTSAPHTERHPIMAGVTQPQFHSAGTLYRSRNVPQRHVLLQGMTTDQGQIVSEPVAWTHTYQSARVFYTSLGHQGDFEIPTFRTILTNAIFWALDRPGPNAEAHRAALEQKEGERSKLKEEVAGSAEILELMKNFAGKGEIGDDSKPTPPPQATAEFQVHRGFEMELVASEPDIAQPLYIQFDHRGRMWVVQYLQYPFPAGLKVVEYDQYLRAVFDKVPEPPPHGAQGADKITVLEDTTGDGHYDKSTDVITGLNITSSVLLGRGGIWVLNPPYLLFYPDRDGDDVPDAEPSVEVRGFGLEDTHSVANSMQWGPDGWIYGANGSTTTATIHTAVTKDLHFKGQCIWRFHPETKEFEIFGEGGGNTFSFEFDAKGRAFSGTNHGSTRGMHYVQGMYGEKNFGKHGPLTNPYAFGYFRHMKHEGYDERFPQTFLIYEGAVWPPEYDHQIVHANSLHNRVQASQLIRDTSSWRTEDTDLLVLTPDRWFRPVDLKAGPDGNVYIADWYDSRLTHVDPRDNWHKKSGRIYRLKAEGSAPAPVMDLSKLDSHELLEVLRHDNKWYRQQAQRLIGDRRDVSMLPKLTRWLREDSGQLALEALWAIHKIGGLEEPLVLQSLQHSDPHVRRWSVRLVGDSRQASPAVARQLEQLAANEPDVEVRSQLASTAKRLPPQVAMPVIRELLQRSEDVDDLHLPLLLWWAVEAHADTGRQLVLEMFRDAELWAAPIVAQTITERLMQRYAMAGAAEDFVTAAKLLALAPGAEHKQRLMAGLEQAFAGRVATDLPPEFRQAVADYQASMGSLDVALGLRMADPQAVPAALAVVADPTAAAEQRLQYVEILGQIKAEAAIPVLLAALDSASQPKFQRAVLTALAAFDELRIGAAVVPLCYATAEVPEEVQAAALEMLTSRPQWTLQLLEAVDDARVDPRSLPFEYVQKMGMHDDSRIASLRAKHWGQVRSTPAEKQRQIARLAELIRSDQGDSAAGKQLFTKYCASCHRLFGEGAQTGPDLTGYERTNLDFMLLAMVDPSAGIREEYTNFMLLTDDGRTLTGFLGDSNERTVSIQGLDGQTQTLPQEQVEVLRALPVSIMPEDLLTGLTDQQIQDLFAYLTSNSGPSN